MSPLIINIMFESNPLKPIMLVPTEIGCNEMARVPNTDRLTLEKSLAEDATKQNNGHTGLGPQCLPHAKWM